MKPDSGQRKYGRVHFIFAASTIRNGRKKRKIRSEMVKLSSRISIGVDLLRIFWKKVYNAKMLAGRPVMRVNPYTANTRLLRLVVHAIATDVFRPRTERKRMKT